MKNWFLILISCVFVSLMASCTVTPGADEEAVLVRQPLIWGHGGICDEAVPTGLKWKAWTTHVEYFKIVPIRYDEQFDDIYSDDRTPLDFNSYIRIQIEKGKSPILLGNYGTDWYKNNIQVPYRNYTREEVSKYSPFDLISNREVLNKIDSVVKYKMDALVAGLSAEKEFPIKIESVITGAASPNEGQKEEMEKTAQMIQAKTTQNREEEMHQAREKSEIARAKADKAYMNALGLTPAQFIELQYIQMIEGKKDANVDVIIGGTALPTMNVKH